MQEGAISPRCLAINQTRLKCANISRGNNSFFKEIEKKQNIYFFSLRRISIMNHHLDNCSPLCEIGDGEMHF
jgi:hypothetical protein